MSWKKWVTLFGMAIVAVQPVLAAREGGLPYRLMNKLRIEYDDNYDQLKDNPRSSWLMVEEVELQLNLNLEQTFIGLNLRPNFVWWENRPGDTTDFHVYADLIVNHNFSRRVSLSFRDTFRRAEEPELTENGKTYRENGDFYFNSADLSLSVLVRPKVYVDVSGGYVFIRYDEKEIANENNYNKYKIGTRARYQLLPETELSANLDYENIDYYDSPVSRSSDSVFAGLGVEHMFTPNLMGSVRGGLQQHENKDSFSSSQTRPYGDMALTILPSPATRISLGAGYSMTETDIYPYTDQEQFTGYAAVSYDITAKLTLTMSGSYSKGNYDAESLPQNATIADLPTKEYEKIKADNPGIANSTPLNEEYVKSISDKTEDTYRFGTSLSYQINRINWLELGWRFSSMDSELRDDFTRNIYHAGWKINL